MPTDHDLECAVVQYPLNGAEYADGQAQDSEDGNLATYSSSLGPAVVPDQVGARKRYGRVSEESVALERVQPLFSACC